MDSDHFEHWSHGGHHWLPADHPMIMGLSTLLWLAFIGLVVWGATWYFQRVQARHQLAAQRALTPIESLREQYALGYINLITFEETVYLLLLAEEHENPRQLQFI